MLCQIGKCAIYAEKHERLLVIDTFNTAFRDDLGRYFTPVENDRIVMANQALLESLGVLEVVPACLSGQVNDYQQLYAPKRKHFITVDTLEAISFDFRQAYQEPLLVHHNCGGGLHSIDALQRLRLTRPMTEAFQARIAALGGPYAAIHVRHTDYQSDYIKFFNSLAGRIPQDRIVICTDNLEVLKYGKRFFRKPVFNFSILPDQNDAPLHSNPLLSKQQVNSDSILDLMTLARANTLFITAISNGARHNGTRYSGYSRLAAALNRNQPIVDSLLSAPGQTAPPGTV